MISHFKNWNRGIPLEGLRGWGARLAAAGAAGAGADVIAHDITCAQHVPPEVRPRNKVVRVHIRKRCSRESLV